MITIMIDLVIMAKHYSEYMELRKWPLLKKKPLNITQK